MIARRSATGIVCRFCSPYAKASRLIPCWPTIPRTATVNTILHIVTFSNSAGEISLFTPVSLVV